MESINIGTSGYAYPHWRKIFYPLDLAPAKWFEFYASYFSSLELNVSFYRLPDPKAFDGWYRRSPKDFSFFVKGSRFITHIKQLRNCREPLQRFFEASLELREKFAGVLWQLPPQSKKNSGKLREFLGELGRFPVKRHVFEFRHPSWFDEETASVLKEAGAVFCRPDKPDFYDSLEIPDTGPFIYFRRHGARNRTGSYTGPQLENDAARIREWQHAGKDVFIYFNNDGGGAAVRNGEKLKEILSLKPEEALHA